MNRKDFENLEAGTLVTALFTASMNSYEPGLLKVIRTEGDDVLVEANSKHRWLKYQVLKLVKRK